LLKHPALDVFDELPLKERLFVRARLFSSPLADIADEMPSGAIADIGCGHGLLTAMLALNRPDRRVLGVDPDRSKIDWANRGPGYLSNVELKVARIEDLLPAREKQFDAVAVNDVLYLLPVDQWAAFLGCAYRLLKPGGELFLKEAEGDRSWKHYKCLLQEVVMVNLVGKTKGSGALQLKPRDFTEALLAQVGFEPGTTVDLSAGFTTPHVLFRARRPR
jgi:2-polyprenyl-6-hydroxyphenyl methylase/3-demethylubiquinone-9 3-methyltransferase